MSMLSSFLGGITKGPLGSLLNFIPGVSPWLTLAKLLSGQKLGIADALTALSPQVIGTPGAKVGSGGGWLGGGVNKAVQAAANAGGVSPTIFQQAAGFLGSGVGKNLVAGLQSGEAQNALFGANEDAIKQMKRLMAEKYGMADLVDKYDAEALAAYQASEMQRGARESSYVTGSYGGDPDAFDSSRSILEQIPLAGARERTNAYKANQASTRLQRKSSLMPNAQDAATLGGLIDAWQSRLMPWMQQQQQDLAALYSGGAPRPGSNTPNTPVAAPPSPWKLPDYNTGYRRATEGGSNSLPEYGAGYDALTRYMPNSRLLNMDGFAPWMNSLDRRQLPVSGF